MIFIMSDTNISGFIAADIKGSGGWTQVMTLMKMRIFYDDLDVDLDDDLDHDDDLDDDLDVNDDYNSFQNIHFGNLFYACHSDL